MNLCPLTRLRSAGLVALGALLCSVPVVAAPAEKSDKPSADEKTSRILVVPHPCNIAMAEPAEEKVLAARCALAVAKIPWADLLGSDEVQAWFRKEGRESCTADPACLAKMAEDLRSNLALFVTIGARHPRGIYLRVLLVKPYSDAEHRIAKDEEWTLPRPAKFTPDAVAALVEQQIQRLPRPLDRDVVPLPLVAPSAPPAPPAPIAAAPAAPAAPVPAAPEAPTPAVERPSPIPGIAIAGAGAVAAGVGVWLLAGSRADWDEFMTYYPTEGAYPPFEQRETVVGLYKSAVAKRNGGITALVGGGVALAVGGVMAGLALTSPEPKQEKPPAALKVSVGPGSWAVTLEGRWP